MTESSQPLDASTLKNAITTAFGKLKWDERTVIYSAILTPATSLQFDASLVVKRPAITFTGTGQGTQTTVSGTVERNDLTTFQIPK